MWVSHCSILAPCQAEQCQNHTYSPIPHDRHESLAVILINIISIIKRVKSITGTSRSHPNPVV